MHPSELASLPSRKKIACIRRSIQARALLGTFLLGSFALVATASAQVISGANAVDDDIFSADIEQLMRIPVTTVTGTASEWFQSPSAIYVITGEDVRRTGHRTLADALRVAPGVFVGQTNSHAWTVGMRGFSGGLANKTLILIDGRAVYDPLFGGTFWDVQDILMEDLDRIEVIRGPGATLWGANAVNGVVNVITKSAKDTQGLFISGGAGTEEQGFGSIRYGGKISETAHFRVWGKYFNRETLELSTGGSAHDDWDMGHGGFRFDATGEADTFFTVQSDVYNSGRQGQLSTLSNGWANGGNILARMGQEAPDHSSGWSLQTYYDRTNRQQGGLRVERDTGDLDFRHHFLLGDSHDLMWGVGYRHSRDETVSTPAIIYAPSSRSLNTFTAFIQDTITLSPGRWFAMIGTKLEHNSFTGFEIQPSGRLWWTPDERNTLWASISRPVRVPSRTEQDSTIIGGPGFAVLPNPNAESERLLAYEVGYRRRFNDDITVDIAAFYNDYSRLLFVPPTIFGTWTNDGYGETYGAEITATWRVAHNWRLEASYSALDVQIHGPIFNQDEGNAPHHQFKFRSYLDITEDLEFNAATYFVDSVATPNAGPYFRVDLGFTWHVSNNFELAIWGQNLLEPSHREASASIEVERSFFLQGTLRY